MTTNPPASTVNKPLRRRSRIAMLLAAVAAVIGLAALPALTASASPAPAKTHAGAFATKAPNPQTSHANARRLQIVSSSHKAPVRTYFQQANPSSALTADTFEPVGTPISVSCTRACSLEADSYIQVGLPATNGAEFAVGCISVDGGPILDGNGDCPYTGEMATSAWTAGAWEDEATGLAVGTHTVQFYVFANSNATLANYNNSVKVYQP